MEVGWLIETMPHPIRSAPDRALQVAAEHRSAESETRHVRELYSLDAGNALAAR